MSPEHFDRALEYFERSIALDPSFGPAYAGASDVWGAYAYWGLKPPSEVRELIWAPLRKALRVDKGRAEVHMHVGIAHFYLERNWEAAESHLQLAIELNPNLAHAQLLYGLFTIAMRRPDAVDWIDNAARLDPVNPAIQLARALLAMSLNKQEDALKYVDRVLEIDPAHPPGNQLRANLAWHMGESGRTRLESRLWANDPEIYSLFKASDIDPQVRMVRIAQILQARSKAQYVPPMQIARAFCLGGDPESALEVLAAANEAGNLIQIDFLQSDCVWHPLRSHPKFRKLTSKIGIPS
jgi:tetratricopeptide (TPR) repeat protein